MEQYLLALHERSSDLPRERRAHSGSVPVIGVASHSGSSPRASRLNSGPPLTQRACTPKWARSEEHTSELQSQSNLVCRLLLEKKNDKEQDDRHAHIQE